jgi:hypothetical protein
MRRDNERKTNNIQHRLSREAMKKPKPKYTEEFLRFWKLYPPRYHEAGRPKAGGGMEHYWKTGKRDAFNVWRDLSDEDKKWAMHSVKFLRKGQYVKDAFRWLRDSRFEDIDMPEEEGEHLPEEYTNVIKIVDNPQVNTNNERNRQMRGLAERN